MNDYKSTHDARLRQADWAGRLVRYWPQIISLISSFATIVGLIIAVFSVNDKATLSVIYAVELSAFSLFLMGYVIFQEYRFSRKARYAEAMYSIHSCVHFLRDYQFDEKILKDPTDCQEQLKKVVTSLANAFSLVTGTHCRACIKTLEVRGISQDNFQNLQDNNAKLLHLFVNTFCRDEITTTASVNKAESKDKYTHHVIGNTDFRVLYLDVNKRIFFCNDIQACGGDYQNSSTQTGQKISYRSVITWPIRKLVYKQDQDDAGKFNEDQDILGFLCVDSARRNIFREDYDREMGAIVADSLFVFLKKYHDYFPNK